jgi:hypothetical protein
MHMMTWPVLVTITQGVSHLSGACFLPGKVMVMERCWKLDGEN